MKKMPVRRSGSYRHKKHCLKLVLKRYEMLARFMSVFALHAVEVVFLSK